jgi:thiol-disulfide isomerase/thioredoxin
MSLTNIVCALLTAFALVFGSAHAESAEAYDIYGKPYHFSLPPGKWIIINYWAAWCGYCIREIPELNRLAKKLASMPVVFFGVNFDNAPDQEQQAFASANNINYPLLHSNPFQTLLAGQEVAALPTTFIISPTGNVQVMYGELHTADVLDAIR